MQEILFTTGTTKGVPKPVHYNSEDWEDMVQCAGDMVKIYGGEKGTIYNCYPHSSNLGFWITHEYARLTDSLCIEVGMAEPEKIVNFFKSFPPMYISGLGLHLLPVMRLANKELKDGQLNNLKHFILGKSILPYREELEKIIPKECKIHAIYGTTELKKAWTTCDNLDSGYHVFDKGFEVSEEGELVYRGIRTSDTGEVIDGECPFCKKVCLRISLKVERMPENKTAVNSCGVGFDD